MNRKPASYYIEKLGLSRHVEGGAFRETYRSSIILPHAVLPKDFCGNRNASTMIYFLLEHGQFSAFHRIASDEAWHFYDGKSLTIYEITKEGKLLMHKLGCNLDEGENFQCVISAGSWFGSRCEIPGGFSLVGCTVAPGFDFADFELANRELLCRQYPQHQEIIKELTSLSQ